MGHPVSYQNLSIRFQSWYQAAKRKMNSNIQDALEIFHFKKKNQTIWLAERIMESKFKKHIFPIHSNNKEEKVKEYQHFYNQDKKVDIMVSTFLKFPTALICGYFRTLWTLLICWFLQKKRSRLRSSNLWQTGSQKIKRIQWPNPEIEGPTTKSQGGNYTQFFTISSRLMLNIKKHYFIE